MGATVEYSISDGGSTVNITVEGDCPLTVPQLVFCLRGLIAEIAEDLSDE